MNPSGWIMMLLCVGGVTVFFGWTVKRVLSSDGDKLHSDADRPPDTDDSA